jgi:hypothetical protein
MTFQHNQDVEEINLLQTEIEMETSQKLKEITANQNQACRIIEAENVKHLAEIRSQAFEAKVINEAEAYKTKMHTEADIKAKIIK